MQDLKLKISWDTILTSTAFYIPINIYLNSLLRGSKTVWLILLFVIIISLINKKKIRLNKENILSLFFLILFSVITIFYYLFVNTNEHALNLSVSFITYILLFILDSINWDRNKRATIIYFLIIAIAIQVIISIPYLINSPSLLIRQLASGSLSEDLSDEAIRHGVGTNALYTSLVPFALYGFYFQRMFRNRIIKISLIISSIAFIVAIAISTFFAAILLLCMSAIIILLYNKIKVKHLLFILGISIAVFFTINKFFGEEVFRPVEKKIEAYSLGENDPTGRMSLAKVSMNTFYDNPLFGIGVPPTQSYSIIGDHMPWVDFLAYFGIFGYIPFLLFFIFRITGRVRASKSYTKDMNLICGIGILLFLISNFISPMLLTPLSYIGFIYIFTSPYSHLETT